VALQPVEQRLAYPVGRGAQAFGIGEFQLATAPFTRNDAQAILFTARLL
jgi:hypothetical protein